MFYNTCPFIYYFLLHWRSYLQFLKYALTCSTRNSGFAFDIIKYSVSNNHFIWVGRTEQKETTIMPSAWLCSSVRRRSRLLECRCHGILDLTCIVHFLDVTETRSPNESENTGILTNQPTTLLTSTAIWIQRTHRATGTHSTNPVLRLVAQTSTATH